MKWRKYTGQRPRGDVLYRYPATTGSAHPSNDRPPCYSLELWGNRTPSHYAKIEPPADA